ncbi:MAG: hypothetical protein JWR79_802 [Tardiphaga sp.]|nr:hypothetical protein [Tardiphaga sp.]
MERTEADSDARVRHRHVIYVQGYDPRGLAPYYRMFRTELRRFAQLYGITTTITRPKSAADGSMASWAIETSAADWRTHTSYDFLRFEDLIQDDLQWPIWRTLMHAIAIYWRLVFAGTLRRFWKAHWRFAIFISYPHFVLLNETIWAAGIAWAFAALLSAIGLPNGYDIAAGGAVFVAALGLFLKYTEKRTYLLYLMSDTIFTWRFAHRQRPDWDARIDAFARHLADVAASSDADEILLVGHSSGSFLGVEIMARALALDPKLGHHRPRVVLLTLGGNLPIVGFHEGAHDFRAHLAALAVEPSIDWVDCQSRKDVMSFFPFDPITGHGIDVGTARRNPVLVSVRFRDIINPEHYKRFRWRFFRVHFQFVMANDRPHAYDFFMIACGPLSLMRRMHQPAAALDIAIGELVTQARAWKQLEISAGRMAVPGTSELADICQNTT